MSRNVRRRCWFEVTLAVISGVLLVVTLISREWIELVFGIDPDGGNGSLEWAIVLVLATITAVSFFAARHEWARREPASA